MEYTVDFYPLKSHKWKNIIKKKLCIKASLRRAKRGLDKELFVDKYSPLLGLQKEKKFILLLPMWVNKVLPMSPIVPLLVSLLMVVGMRGDTLGDRQRQDSIDANRRLDERREQNIRDDRIRDQIRRDTRR